MHRPEFIPHPLVRGAHAQTLVGVMLPARGPSERTPVSTWRIVNLSDGDALVLHDDRPDHWEEGQPAALLLHGLCGDATSPYMLRISAKLRARGVRVFRMDLRGTGAGFSLAKHNYHSGRSEDVAAAVRSLTQLLPGSPLSIVGFSLGGNLLLKCLGDWGNSAPESVKRAMAVSPPIDLLECVARLREGVGAFYDRYFTRMLVRLVEDRARRVPGAPKPNFPRPPRKVTEFDEAFTVPVCGFRSTSDYYERSSAAPGVPHISIPTRILVSRDDPVVSTSAFERLPRGGPVDVWLTPTGGHMGFLGRSGGDPDRRWMDWRVVEWIAPLSRNGFSH
jgi:predicted alpha/beta-fold hydrolase